MMTNTIGRFHSAAMFSDSWKAPMVVVPSPMVHITTSSPPR